ncbi:MAG: corrinoid protein [Deltaproteobacteria bacterium]|nr:corrinoid protein [Candidatus Zymogenaceae bacterium]
MSYEILDSITQAVIDMRFEDTGTLTRDALGAGVGAVEIINGALLPALDRVGILFREGDYFLPDVLMSVKAYHNSFEILEPLLKEGDYKARGKIMIGTVFGDIHDIGKNILSALLLGNGFEVIDVGVDVKPEIFLTRAKQDMPDIIGMSALLTTTMPSMKDTIDVFVEAGLREKFKFIIGGAPLNQKFADEIGADGYGEDAQSGVELVKRLMGI